MGAYRVQVITSNSLMMILNSDPTAEVPEYEYNSGL